MTTTNGVIPSPPTPEPDWAAVRRRHPAACEQVFLNAGSKGLLSEAARVAAARSLDADLHQRPDTPPAPEQLVEVRGLVERLLGAEPGTVAVTKNVSEGLNAIVAALGWQPGDNVVLCSDVEHANNVYVWRMLETRGIELRDVPPRDGAIDARAMADAMDARTRAVTASAVTFSPGFRTDLEAIGRAAEATGALFLVDGVQACGVLRVDVAAAHVGALATSTSKGLLGVRGLGFLYVAKGWARRLTPRYVARTSIDTGGRHYSQFEPGAFRLHDGARRFECGNYNYTGIAIARAALTEILDLGIARIEARAVGLATALADGLADQGWPVSAPPPPLRRSHIVTVGRRTDGGPDTTGDPRLDAFARALETADVRLAIRRGQLRFGFHFYNDESDVAAVLSVGQRVA